MFKNLGESMDQFHEAATVWSLYVFFVVFMFIFEIFFFLPKSLMFDLRFSISLSCLKIWIDLLLPNCLLETNRI